MYDRRLTIVNRLLWVAVACFSFSAFMTSCASVQAKLVPLAQSTVSKYCAIPVEQRVLIRAQVNAAIAPDKIVVTCANDPPSAAKPEPATLTTR